MASCAKITLLALASRLASGPLPLCLLTASAGGGSLQLPGEAGFAHCLLPAAQVVQTSCKGQPWEPARPLLKP